MSDDLSFLTPVQPDQGKVAGIDVLHMAFAAAMALALAGCSLGGLGGPYPGVPELQSAPRYDPRGRPEWVPPSSGGVKKAVAPPQVTYRIDENRYFELVHHTHQSCANAGVFYVDKALGIRSFVVTLDPAVTGASNFIIDAANDQYLIGPMTRGNTDCSSGGGGCGGASMPYSTDAGRTWRRASPPITGGYELYLAGEAVFYAGQRARLPELSTGDEAWKQFYLVGKSKPPTLNRKPIDNKFHCTENGKE